jgi:hypothetical protein
VSRNAKSSAGSLVESFLHVQILLHVKHEMYVHMYHGSRLSLFLILHCAYKCHNTADGKLTRLSGK